MESMIQDLKKILPFLAAILVAAYAFSLFAEYNWAFDLFSHFKIQYAIGGIILFPLMMYFHQYYYVPFVLIIGLLSIWDITRAYDPTENVSTNTQKVITIAQYNKLFTNTQYSDIRQWLEQNTDIDIVFIQESTTATIDKLREFKDLYPYQFPNFRQEQVNDITILSKIPFSAQYFTLSETIIHWP